MKGVRFYSSIAATAVGATALLVAVAAGIAQPSGQAAKGDLDVELLMANCSAGACDGPRFETFAEHDRMNGMTVLTRVRVDN